MAGLDGRVFFLNDAARELVGLPRNGAALPMITDFFPPDQADTLATEVLSAVQQSGSWIGERQFRHFGTGELIPVLYNVIPVHGHDGALVGYGTVTRDLRERKLAEERQRLLNTELGHRLKNVLTVVQSVAAQTLRQAPDLKAANIALSARLAALGEAVNVLTASSWSEAHLRTLILGALSPHGDIGSRFRLNGPDLTLQPQVGLAFALALHELATNAAKYGALSRPEGHVELTWRITTDGDGAEPQFLFDWREVGGPAVRPPDRRGFGSIMIERSLRAYFRGEATITYPATGVEFHLEGPLRDAVQPGE